MRFIVSILLSFIFSITQAKEITATSWLVADEDGIVLKGQNINEVRSIASISKLMTTMVVLNAKIGRAHVRTPVTDVSRMPSSA